MSTETPKGGAPCAAAIIDGTRSALAGLNNLALIMRDVQDNRRPEFTPTTADEIARKLERVIAEIRSIEKLARHEGVAAFGKAKG